MSKQAAHRHVGGVLLTAVSLLALPCPAIADAPDILFLTKPATNWEKEAFPLGNGRLVSATLHSRNGSDAVVRYGQKTRTLKIKPGQSIELNGQDLR